MPRVRIAVDPAGGVEATVEGVPGPGCRTLTAELEAVLGPAVLRRPTPERWQHAPAAEARRADAAEPPR